MKILLAIDQAMLRDGLQHALRDHRPNGTLVAAVDSWHGALAAMRDDPAFSVVVVDLDMVGFSFSHAIDQLHVHAPGLPMVAISGCADPQRMKSILHSGAAGYVPKRASGPVLMGAIGLAVAGGMYVPPELLRRPEPISIVPEPQPEVTSFHTHAALAHPDLTRRQAEVLTLMAQGKPNKVISRELGIAAGTVKVHVTALLRALKVNNRTQAVSAMLTGITPASGLGHRSAAYLN